MTTSFEEQTEQLLVTLRTEIIKQGKELQRNVAHLTDLGEQAEVSRARIDGLTSDEDIDPSAIAWHDQECAEVRDLLEDLDATRRKRLHWTECLLSLDAVILEAIDRREFETIKELTLLRVKFRDARQLEVG